MIMIFQTIAIVVMLILFFFDRNMLRVEWKAVQGFVVFIILLSAARFAVMYGVAIPKTKITPITLLFVGLEDLAFGGALYLFEKYISSKKRYLYPVILFSSLAFGFGHVYQGNTWAVMTVFVPWFIFVKYGKRHGFGTTMICHTFYDIATIFLIKIMYIINTYGV